MDSLLKNIRKSYANKCYYFLTLLLDEIAKRLSVSLEMVRMISPTEMEKALVQKNFDLSLLPERKRLCVLKRKDLDYEIFVSDQARILKEEAERDNVGVQKDVLEGMTAFPGYAKGRVKIVNREDEVGKVEKGDILVSSATGPSLTVAMEKAAAIVTDIGGMTCHLAIVARELKIPCIVGTGNATKILRDGDLLEVDASKGVARKL